MFSTKFGLKTVLKINHNEDSQNEMKNPTHIHLKPTPNFVSNFFKDFGNQIGEPEKYLYLNFVNYG